MFSGFVEEDFAVFDVPGLDERMAAIKTHIRPKFEQLASFFQPYLAANLGEEVFVHIAKHARRTVNPPKDTWVAFSTNARGYKQHPHFQIGIWPTHVFVAFGYIYEAPRKVEFGQFLEQHAALVENQIPSDFIYIPDHTRPEWLSANDVPTDQIRALGTRLQSRKNGELLIGRQLPREQAMAYGGEAFLQFAQSTFATLLPLFKMNISK